MHARATLGCTPRARVETFARAKCSSTVDSYQGREKDVILFSITSTSSFGFIEDENKLNVAFTRAKKKLIVIGNRDAILHNTPYGLLSEYIQYAASRNGYIDENSLDLEQSTSRARTVFI